MNVRVMRGKVLVRRDEWARKMDSAILDIEIPATAQEQTWQGEVIAVGPPSYQVRTVSDGMDRGVPRYRTRVKTHGGKPLTVGAEIRKGDRVRFPFACRGSVEVLIDGVRHVFVPQDQILYVESNEALA